nr:hypothetical protein [Tanacetum cinerariifolium]
MERYEIANFNQCEEINHKMTKMTGLLKELMTNRAPKKVLIREEAKFLITKNVNSISLTRGEEERSKKTDVTTGDDIEKPTKTEMKMPIKEAKKEDEAENESNRKARKEERTRALSYQPVKYYLKHRINEKLIEGRVDNHRLVLEWEERIKLHLVREMEFDQWKSKNFKGKHPALLKVEVRMDDEGEVT